MLRFHLAAIGGSDVFGDHPIRVGERCVSFGCYIDSNNTLHGFVYSDGNYTTLDDPLAGAGSPTGDLGTLAFGINDSGGIVGTYDAAQSVRH